MIEENGRIVLELPGPSLRFFLLDHPERAGLIAQIRSAALGKVLLIEGTIPEPPKRRESGDILQIRSYSIPSGG